MSKKNAPKKVVYLENFTSQKVNSRPSASISIRDTLLAWMERYQQLAIAGVRSPNVTQKIRLHLHRFHEYFLSSYGHDRISALLRRDVQAWQTALKGQGLAPSTINNHLASLSAFTTWVNAQAPHLFPAGDPVKGISELGLPPLEPRALTPEQVRSLKSLCDRLPRLHLLKGRRWKSDTPARTHIVSRAWRDRAIVFVLLSIGLRRKELTKLDLDQLHPYTPEELRVTRQAQIRRMQGKGKTERNLFLSRDTRQALADYLERERPRDATENATAMFLSAQGLPARSTNGQLSPRALNLVLEQIGWWHDAEMRDESRHISPLRPHDLRHTFAFTLHK